MATASMEDLSSELFYDIFDYFDGYHLYRAFSNLNHRFQQLLNSSTLLLKIHFHSTDKETSMNEFQQLILHHKHQVISLDFYLPTNHNYFCSSFTIDSSFNRLESLTLNRLDPALHTLLTSNLTSLPRLLSLTIDTWYSYKDLGDVYRLIFALPKLKYGKCSRENHSVPVSLAMATDQQFSFIKHLVIDHYCTFKDLAAILSHTPQLSYLKFKHTDDDDSTLNTLSLITLPNLTSISMYLNSVTFNALQWLISRLDCELKVLRVSTQCPDEDYFNEFYFEYTEDFDPEYDIPIYSQDPNQFTSSFWLERQWLLEIETNSFDVEYSIRPYKERWYDAIGSTDLSKSTRLTISFLPQSEEFMSFAVNIRDILSIAHIYHLEITDRQYDFSVLIDVINTLSKLNSLKIHSVSLYASTDVFTEHRKLCLIPKTNKITKVCLEKMNEIDDVFSLMELCPRMNYLQVDCINHMDIELFVENILSRIHANNYQYLRLLCFRIPTADDKIVRKLEKLFVHYTIERVLDRIYLRW